MSGITTAEDVLQRPLTRVELEARWAIQGPTKKARQKALKRRCDEWHLNHLRGTRGDNALYRLVDVIQAEARGAS